MQIKISKKKLKIFVAILLIFAITYFFYPKDKENSITRHTDDLNAYLRPLEGSDKVTFKIEKNGNNYKSTITLYDKSYQMETPKDQFDYDTLRYFVREAAFAACLKEKDVKIFLGSNQMSQQQYEQLGKFNVNGRKIVADVGDIIYNCGASDKLCSQLKINETPAVVYKGILYPGVKSAKWFHGLAGCEGY